MDITCLSQWKSCTTVYKSDIDASNSFPLPDALEDGAEQVGGVEAREADEEQVERVPHLLPRDDDRGDRVAHDP